MARYQSDPAGLRELGQSADATRLCMDAARSVTARANALDPQGEYRAQPAGIPVGWRNEIRAGAVVEQTRDSAGGRDRALLTAVQQSGLSGG